MFGSTGCVICISAVVTCCFTIETSDSATMTCGPTAIICGSAFMICDSAITCDSAGETSGFSVGVTCGSIAVIGGSTGGVDRACLPDKTKAHGLSLAESGSLDNAGRRFVLWRKRHRILNSRVADQALCPGRPLERRRRCSGYSEV